MNVIYTDTDIDYSEPGSGPDGSTLNQPPGWAVAEAEEEFDGVETTWPEVNKRAWEIAEADDR